MIYLFICVFMKYRQSSVRGAHQCGVTSLTHMCLHFVNTIYKRPSENSPKNRWLIYFILTQHKFIYSFF